MDLDCTFESYVPPKKKVRSRNMIPEKPIQGDDVVELGQLSQFRFAIGEKQENCDKATDGMKQSHFEIINCNALVAKEETVANKPTKKTKRKRTSKKKEPDLKRLASKKRKSVVINCLESDVKLVCESALGRAKLNISQTNSKPGHFKLADFSRKTGRYQVSDDSLWKITICPENLNTSFDNSELGANLQDVLENTKRVYIFEHSDECELCRSSQSTVGVDLMKLRQPEFSHLQTEKIQCKDGVCPVSGLIYQLRVETPLYDLSDFTIEVVADFIDYLYSARLPNDIYRDTFCALEQIAILTQCVTLKCLLEKHNSPHVVSEQPVDLPESSPLLGYENPMPHDNEMLDSLWIGDEVSQSMKITQLILNGKNNSDFDKEEESFLNYLERTQLNRSILNLDITGDANECRSFDDDLTDRKIMQIDDVDDFAEAPLFIKLDQPWQEKCQGDSQLKQVSPDLQDVSDEADRSAEENEPLEQNSETFPEQLITTEKTSFQISDSRTGLDQPISPLIDQPISLLIVSETECESTTSSVEMDLSLRSRLKLTQQVGNPPEASASSEGDTQDLSEDKIFGTDSQEARAPTKKSSKIRKRLEPDFDILFCFVKSQPHLWCKILQYKPIHLLSFMNDFAEKMPDYKLKDSVLKIFFDQLGVFCSEKSYSTVY